MSILRPYQAQAVTAAWAALIPGDTNRVAIEMATGLGKTITFAAQIDGWLDSPESSGLRALVLVHTDELVRQAVDKIKLVATSQPWTIGVVKAAEDEVDADIVVASVQTLRQPHRLDRLNDVGLIIVDEAHHAVAATYQTILAKWPTVPTFGYTATLARSDGKGLGVVWQDLAFSRSLPWAVRQGWLVDLVPWTIKIPGLDAGASDQALDAQLAESIAPEAVVQAWMDHVVGGGQASGLSTVLFAPLVRSAEAFRDAFLDKDIKAEVVHGAMPSAERRAVLDRYESGVTTVLCNAMVLTEGWDSPRTSCVIVARPTQSVPLFVQMVGRGLRPWLAPEAPPRERQRCILLCVAGTATDLATVADLSDKVDEAKDGKSLLAMEDEYDLGADIPEDEDNAYRGPVRVEQWDALVQRSSKAWKYTEGGIPFLPVSKRGQGYVFVVQWPERAEVWARKATAANGRTPALVQRLATAPDLELAMAVAEDEAQEIGGDIGALLADKTRPWRKAVPSLEALGAARAMGVPEDQIQTILKSKAAGKAGKLSDLMDKLTATRVLDHLTVKIKERGSK